ncbi:MFS transporter [Aquamicrobium sp. LC103]|uniref:MFS transporter n=1 Tax=Aquamicrobium sp. LC103 TaxID=1120658 RepID=UPI00063EA01D|nr:MFS transporter [Aquamicrobium sp. LC103]TKT75057.1 MFS transporter [Aquamicrobium sp. LC103]
MNRAVPLVLAVALFMEQMDSTVIATSLPAIAADIGTSPITLKLALTAYLVALAIFIPVSGWMADRFGAKRVFRIAIAIFMLGSIASAASGSLGEFVMARFLQGMGGAMMTPVGRLVLVRSTPRNQLVAAMAWLTVPALVGPLVGPPVGGFITTFFTWHWIFLINIPIGLIGIVVAGRILPDMPGGGAAPLDARGLALAAIAAAGIVFGLSVVSLPALPPAVGIATLALGAVAAVAYVRHAHRTANPILDLRLLDNPVPRIAILSGSIFRIGIGAIPFLLPLMFQLAFGLTPFESGMLTFASAMGAISLKFFATTFLKAIGFRNVLLFASLAGALLMAANAFFNPQTPHWTIIVILVAAGFLRSLFFTSNNALVFAEIDDRQASQATAIAAVSQQISIALGVAVAGMLLEGHHFVTGEPIGLAAFSFAFLVIALIAAMSALPILRLAPDAGMSVSGHLRKKASEEEPPSVM